MFRYLFILVHLRKRFMHVKITFPVRGRSYMECDAYTVKVNQKLNAEVPADWARHFKVAQSIPHNFIVNQPGREDFYNFGAFLVVWGISGS